MAFSCQQATRACKSLWGDNTKDLSTVWTKQDVHLRKKTEKLTELLPPPPVKKSSLPTGSFGNLRRKPDVPIYEDEDCGAMSGPDYDCESAYDSDEDLYEEEAEFDFLGSAKKVGRRKVFLSSSLGSSQPYARDWGAEDWPEEIEPEVREATPVNFEAMQWPSLNAVRFIPEQNKGWTCLEEEVRFDGDKDDWELVANEDDVETPLGFPLILKDGKARFWRNPTKLVIGKQPEAKADLQAKALEAPKHEEFVSDPYFASDVFDTRKTLGERGYKATLQKVNLGKIKTKKLKTKKMKDRRPA